MHSCTYVQQAQAWRHYRPLETQADGHSLSGEEERGLEEQEVGERGGRAGERQKGLGGGKVERVGGKMWDTVRATLAFVFHQCIFMHSLNFHIRK